MLLICSLGIWAVESAVEQNFAILVFATGTAAVGLLICRTLPSRKEVLLMFSAGLFIRSVVAIAAWWLTKETEFGTWTGSNEDSNRYYWNSLLSLHDSLYTTEDMGFPAINWAITEMASRISGPHYLCNVQVPLVFGALFPVAVFAVAKMRLNEQTAKLVGWLLVLHPIVIGWSSGLMRDTIVAGASWLFLYHMLRASESSGFSGTSHFLIALGYGALTGLLRSTNLLVMVACYCGLMVCDMFRQRVDITKLFTLVSAMTILGLMVFSLLPGRSVWERSGDMFEYGSVARETVGQTESSVNAGGISELIARQGSSGLLVLTSPYILIQPFPFYAPFVMPDRGGYNFVDMLFGLGGLLNQIMFPLYCGGLWLMVRMRRWDLMLLCGPFVWGMCVVGMTVGFQTRWIMSVAYAPMLFAASLAISRAVRKRGSGAFIWCLAGSFVFLEYTGYGLVKADIYPIFDIGFILPLLAFILVAECNSLDHGNEPRLAKDKQHGKLKAKS